MAQEHRTNIAEGRVDSMDKVLETPTTESLLSEYKAEANLMAALGVTP